MTTVQGLHLTAPAVATGPADRRFRPELQGLRALAATLVVVYHVWFGRVSGGVDVFFVLSGFLLTGQLARAVGRGSLDLPARWSRMLMRLLPSMAVVLVATSVAAVVLLPDARWEQTLREVAAAALFLENWQLAADSVDYAARNNVTSVVQHYWSLSIQGQFFLFWPLLLAGVAWAARDSEAGLRTWLRGAVAGVFAASLAYSILLTATNQPLAYFHSFTRLWEFALGGLLALSIGSVGLTARVRLVLGWLGVAGLLLCGIVIDVSSAFPGYAALWPTGCAVLVLVAGSTGHRWGADRLLSSRPFSYLGDLSFTLYLWHWPVLMLFLATRHRDQVGLAEGMGIIALSALLAVATHHLVEKPLIGRRVDTRTGYRQAALAVALVLIVVTGWQTESNRRADVGHEVGDARYPGAVALVAGAVDPAPAIPPLVSVFEDWVRIEKWDCTPLAGFPTEACSQPTPGTPTKRVVVVGDSHIQQLSGALIPIAERQGWQLTTIVFGACPFSTASEVTPGDQSCLDWNAAALAEITALRPDAVVTLASRDVRVGLTEQTPPGFVEQWRRLDELGISVLAVRDNPRFDTSRPDCIQQNQQADSDERPDAAVCGVARDAVYARDLPWDRDLEIPPNVSFLDIADAVCDPVLCPAEIGNVLVYLDDNHISATYATSMAGLLESAVVAALGDLSAATVPP